MNRIVAAFLLALVALGTTEAAQVPFAERRVAVGTINDPARIALADVDGDGDLDIVAASRADSAITWHENLGGRGAFVTRPIGTGGAIAVLAADLDRDGRVDVAFANADLIGWYPNLGGGTFGDALTITGELPGVSSLTTVDVNGDGYLDIVWTDPVAQRIVLARNPAGGANPWSLDFYPALGSGAPYRSVAFADVDEDGDLDIFAASDDQFVAIESQQGTFGSQFPISSPESGGNAIVAADIDRDGDPDVLTASCSTNSIVWYEPTTGDGWFFAPHVIDSAAPCPTAVSAADVDGDGDLDVVAANSASPDGGAVWYENLAGDFGSPRPLPGSAGGQTDAVAADVDGDGDLDLVSASGASNSVGWNENRTIHRNAAFPIQTTISDALSYTAASVADLNGDGTPDVLGGTGQDETLEAYYSDGAGAFPDSEEVSSGVYLLEAVAAADVDRDGDLDIVAAHDRLSWFENTINPPYGLPPFFGNDELIAPDGDFRSIAVADLNRDGWPDFVTGEGADGSGTENLVAWTHGGPDGALALSWKATAPAVDCAGPTDGASRPWSDPAFDDTSWSPIALPDVWFTSFDDRFYRGTFTYTGAPRPHLLHFSSDDGLQVYVNGVRVVSFRDPFVCQADGCVNAPTCLDNTSIPDVDITALLVPGTNVIAAHVSNGQSLARFNASVAASGVAWGRRGIARPGETVRSVATGDLDGDGDPDVVAGGAACEECGSGFARWYENVGEGGFTPRDALATTGFVRAVAAGDVDRDGRPDVVVGSTEAIAWHRNAGEGAFEDSRFEEPRPVTSQVSSLRALSLVDLDGDGDLDVASVSEQDSKVAWYANDGQGGFGPQRTVASSLGNPNVLAIADLDRDGRIDLLSASESDRHLTWNRNLGGQFTLGATDLAPPLATVGELTPLLGVTMTLNARAGDPAGALTSLDLLLARASETPLTPPEANALVETLYVYRDDGSGAFEPGRDVQVAAVEELLTSVEGTPGREVITFSEDDSNLRVAAPATFFVVVRIAPGAGSAVPDQFRVTLLSPGAGGATSAADSSSGIVLTAEFTPSFASGVTKALAPIVVDTEPDVFSPEDGLTGLREAITRANQNAGEDRIQIGEGVYYLTQLGSGEDVAATGDLDLTDTTGRTIITGAGAGVTIIDATGLGDRVFHVLPGATVEISGVTIRNGVETRGGGILNQGTLSIADSVLTGNTASDYLGNGGAIHNGAEGGDATLTVARSSISGNHADREGGGIGNVTFDGSTARVTIVDTTIAGNTAGNFAGAFANYSQFGGQVVAALVNVTLSGNSNSFAAGGAIDHGAINGGGAASLTLTNTTVFGNISAADGGGIHTNSSTDTLVLRNSVVAGNASGSGVPDIASGDTLVQLDGGNVIGSDAGLNASLTSSDQVGTGNEPIDARLGPLAPNGGPTPTHQPLADSPALDAGFCSAIALDQAGQSRVVDLPSVANRAGGNGCDAGSVELSLAKTLPLIGIPLRWCALAGAPSIATPPPGETANDVLRNRGKKVSEGVYIPGVAMQFRSGASATVLDFPILDTTGLAFGAQGEVFVDPKARNFDEFTLLVNRCRDAWKALDPKVTGITAIHINRFVDAAGQPIELLGLGGRAELGNAAQQVNAGRVMIADDFYRENSNPADTIDRLLGHELGHALSLQHGDGVDNDANGKLDDDDDKVANRARFDGPNLMQYRNGEQISTSQVQQLRAHAITTIPDITLTIDGRTEVADAGLDSGFANVLDFGFANVLDFGFANVLDFGFSQVLDFQFAQVLDFGFAGVLDFGFAEVLDFGFANVLDFGMVFDGDVDGSTTLLSTTGGLPWPSPIRPTTTYYYYMDLDQNVATGGTPSAAGFPATPDDPSGIDLVAETTLSSTCGGSQCDDTVAMRLFRHDGAAYVLVPEGEPALERVSVGLFQDSGGEEVEPENLAVGLSVQATIPNNVMSQAGWTIGAPVRMQALTVVDCPSVDLTLPNGVTTINCRCDSCATCPDYPGCTGTTGTPDTLPEGGRIVADATSVVPLSFEKPVLPECSVAPGTAGPGGRATVHVTGFPSGQTGRSLVAVTGEEELGRADAATITAGAGSVPIVLPGVLSDGALAITVGISGLATEARCSVTISHDTCASDFEPPVIGAIAPITQELTSASGTPVSVPLPGATDDCDPQPTVTSDAPATFPLGQTTVTFTARDAAGNESTSTTTVTIVDTTPPSIDCPASVTVECAGNGQAAVNLPAAASSDFGGGAAPIENSYTAGGADASGSYPLGTTVVTFTATDGSGNSVACATSVTVRDTLAPVVSIDASPGILWPPNHKMTTVNAAVSAVDACDPNPIVVLVSVSSNEPDDAPGGGDGHTTNDIQGVSTGTADFQVQLRAERAGKGDGRAYTLTYRATDDSQNSATSSKDVLAPRALGDVVEPLQLALDGGASTRIAWDPVFGAVDYDVVRGDLASLRVDGSNVDLGTVTCIENNSLDTNTTGHEDHALPQPGQVFFYAVQFFDGIAESSYGSVSVGRARVVRKGAGNCP